MKMTTLRIGTTDWDAKHQHMKMKCQIELCLQNILRVFLVTVFH